VKTSAHPPSVPAQAVAAAGAVRRIVLQNLWAPIRATKASAASSPNSTLLLAGGLLLLFVVLAEIVFLKLSAGLLRRPAVL
jgi:hypothetical protein